MPPGPAPEIHRRRLLARCMEAQPRVVRLIARPGWGKTTFARQLASAYGTSVTVDCRDATSATSLAERLADAFARKPAGVIVDFAERLADVPDAFATLQRILEEQIASCRFVVASRIELPVGAGRAISPADVMTLRAGDLAFDAAEVREVFARLSATEEMLERVIALSLGWPIAIFLFARLAREQRLPVALADLSHPSLDDMFEYGERETFPALTPAQRTGIAAAVAIPDAALDEIEAAVGEAPRQALEEIAARTGLPVTPDGRFIVPEITAEAVRRSLRDEYARARDAAIRHAVAAGAYVRAAQIRFADRDYDGAVSYLDAVGPAGTGATLSAGYRELVHQLPPRALLRSRNVLVAVLADRNTQANPYPLWQTVQDLRTGVQRDNDPELAAGIRAAHAALLRMIERPRDARVELENALAVGDPSPERTALLTANLAAVAAIRGDLATAELLLERAGVPREGATAFPLERIEVEVARNRLHGDPAGRRIAHARYVDEGRLAGPAAHGQALRLFAANEWLDGDDAAAIAALETRNRLVGALPWERRLIGVSLPPLDVRPARLDRWTCLWYTSAALVEDDADTARRFAEVALDALEGIGAPYFDAVASLVAASLPDADAAALTARARSDAAAIGDAAFTAAVEAIAANRYSDADVLLPLARRIESSGVRRASAIRVCVLEGHVVREAQPLPLRERELELVVALALERRPLTREALIARLWPDIAPDEANAALRTAVYRLRKQLRDPGAVVSSGAGYRLAPTIPVDVLEAEQFVAGVRRLGGLSDRERARLVAQLERLSHGVPTVYARWEWFAPYERRVRDLLHNVGVALAEDDLRRGDASAALARAEVLLRADPLDESANEIAIRAHVAAGRKSEALRRYRGYRDALRREYGFEPDARLTGLLEGTSGQ